MHGPLNVKFIIFVKMLFPTNTYIYIVRYNDSLIMYILNTDDYSILSLTAEKQTLTRAECR